MTNFQRGYGEILPDWVPPDVEYTTEKEAKRKAFTAFCRGCVFGAILATGAFIASAAWSETISIGRNAYYHGESLSQTTVTIEPSTVPGQLAIVTLNNNHVNQGSDTGDYSLSLDGVVFGVQFIWDHEPVLGSDRIVITPPAGITCEPKDCGVTVMEGMDGHVVLFEYNGA